MAKNLTRMAVLHFIETTKFSKQIKEQMSDDEYRLFQENLITYPEQGDLLLVLAVFVRPVGRLTTKAKAVAFG